MSHPIWVESWFASLIESAELRTSPIGLSESREWALRDDAIRHRSGRFFNVIGVEWSKEEGSSHYRPILEQREIGTLGSLIRIGDKGKELLIQAKIEPGNVGIVQLAPTCQATASNSDRVNGGEAPLFAPLFAAVQPADYQHLSSE